jgi:hypothetical protein
LAEAFDDDIFTGDQLTTYDRVHVKLYMRLLDANAEGADWRVVAQSLFGIDPMLEPERARRVYDNHLSRARWMTGSGYKHLLGQTRN